MVEVSEEDFKKLGIPSYDFEKDKDEEKEFLIDCYRTIKDILKEYIEVNERYYSIISLWILGTYYQQYFPTYPYLFFNAMKGSGKSRIIRLITTLSKQGSMLNSLTEAVLFRTKGTLGIDEFEGAVRKGNEALKELLNSAYKQGIKIKRMKKVKTLIGEEQVPEEFDVYRPIVMANINGMDNVLEDRCITIILDRSSNPAIVKIMEIYDLDNKIVKIKEKLSHQCRKCSVDALRNVYIEWNNYIHSIYTNNTNNINNTNNTNNTKYIINNKNELFEKIDKTNINGRSLELSLPLFILSSWISEEVLDETLKTLSEIVEEKRKEDSVESLDISLIEHISQQLPEKWISVKELFRTFKDFVQVNDEWFNEKWLGKALKRLSMTKDKKRMSYGRIVLLNIDKAKEKLKMFKIE